MKTVLSQKAVCHKVNSPLIFYLSLPQVCTSSDAQGILLATNDFSSPLISVINSSSRSKQNSYFIKHLCLLVM